jgi:hypothetical protein
MTYGTKLIEIPPLLIFLYFGYYFASVSTAAS